MTAEDSLFFKNSILELRLIKTTCKCCHIWVLLSSGCPVTHQNLEIFWNCYFISAKKCDLLNFDSVELRVIHQWNTSGLTSCAHATIMVTMNLNSSFHLGKSAVLSCDLSKRVEPNNLWWGKGSKVIQETGIWVSHIPIFQINLWSEELVWWIPSTSFCNQLLVCKKTTEYL